MKRIFGYASALLLAATVQAQVENYTADWSQHKDLYISTGAIRANVPGDVTKFPLLVRLSSANFDAGFGQAKAGGADIRFTKANNTTRLHHEIESWDATAKTAAIWVLMDTVYGNTNNQLFRMHWGNSGAADSSKGPAVFDTTNGFVAVWHLNETTAAVGSTIADATGSGNTGKLGLQGSGEAPTNTTAMIGIGKTFSGDVENTNTNGAFFAIRDSATNALAAVNTVNGPFTITAWASPAACAGTPRVVVISKYDNTNSTGTRAWALQTSENGEWRQTLNPNLPEFQSATTGNEFKADHFCSVDQWTYLAGRYEAATAPIPDDALSAEKLTLNVDANPVITGILANQGTGSSIGPDGIVFIGRLMSPANANNRFMRGSLDEITVSKVRRSDNWVKLSYETQKIGANAISDAIVSIHGSASAAASFSVSSMAGGLQFNLPANAAGSAVVTIADMKGRTVWTRTVSTASAATAVNWNGVSDAGSRASAGLYAVKVSLRDANGAALRSMSQKVSFAP